MKILNSSFAYSSLYLVSFLLKLTLAYSEANNNNTFNNKLVYNLTSGLFYAEEVKIFDKIVHKLEGLPYAYLPMPFQKPKEFKYWNSNNNNNKSNITNNNKILSVCIHTSLFEENYYGNFKKPEPFIPDFNCLSITIYIPISINNNKPNTNLSVMFYIHGGSNSGGSSSYIDGSALAALGNVIVAMVNYRLDVLGFFSLPDNYLNIRGNYGLWDQHLALKWVHDNCIYLGCHRHSITVFGQSAGSSDSFLLSLSKISKPYIKRIIMQSGSGLAHWAFNYEKHVLNEADKQLKKLTTKRDENLYLKKLNLINLLKKSRYIKTLEQSFENFLTFSSCELSSKHKCTTQIVKLIEKKYKNILNSNNKKLINIKVLIQPIADSNLEITNEVCGGATQSYKFKSLETLFEYELINLFSRHINNQNDQRFMYLFGIIRKIIYEDENLNQINEILNDRHISRELQFLNENITDTNLIEYLNKYENLNSSSNLVSALNLNKNFDCMDRFSYLDTGYSLEKLCLFINAFYIRLNLKVGFNKEYRNISYFLLSPTIRNYLKCINGSYGNTIQMRKVSKDNELIKVSNLFDLNYKKLSKEIKDCANLGIEYDLKEKNYSINGIMHHSSDYDMFSYSSPKRNIKKELSLLSLIDIHYLLRPNLDADMFIQMPYTTYDRLIKSNNYKIETMIGVTSHESFYFLENDYYYDLILKHTMIYSSMLNLTDNLIEKLIDLDTSPQLTYCMKKKIFEFYNLTKFINSTEYNVENLYGFVELFSDYDFILPLTSKLKLKMERTNKRVHMPKLYVYMFSFVSSFNYLLDYIREHKLFKQVFQVYDNRPIVPHFGELDFVFGLPILSKLNLIPNKSLSNPYNYTQKEYDLSLKVIEYWTNFAKFGNPNGNKKEITWKEFNSQTKNILNIHSNYFKQDSNLITYWLKKHHFWYELLPNKIYHECKRNQ